MNMPNEWMNEWIVRLFNAWIVYGWLTGIHKEHADKPWYDLANEW